MWNDEDLTKIIIKNKDGKAIAELDADTLTCNNKKFRISSGPYEDVLIIQLMQKSYS